MVLEHLKAERMVLVSLEETGEGKGVISCQPVDGIFFVGDLFWLWVGSQLVFEWSFVCMLQF